ncbi:hypothetical protein LP414_11935 [Polaromonas sp. P1(28)-13]|nr:hypothetical protein LP414_11935 [Polaromonas sp. P1(28)-13]
MHDEKEKIDRAQIAQTGTSLERLVEGLLQPARLLDYVENFVLFHRETNKILAQNHQFIGVNHALAQFEERNARNSHNGGARQAGCVLAHAGLRQEFFDGVLCAQDLPQADWQLHLCGGD